MLPYEKIHRPQLKPSHTLFHCILQEATLTFHAVERQVKRLSPSPVVLSAGTAGDTTQLAASSTELCGPAAGAADPGAARAAGGRPRSCGQPWVYGGPSGAAQTWSDRLGIGCRGNELSGVLNVDCESA